MRMAALAFVAALGMIAFSAGSEAAPVTAPQSAPAASAGITLVRGGCGPGWHRRAWRDRWGRWHVRCVPNRRW